LCWAKETRVVTLLRFERLPQFHLHKRKTITETIIWVGVKALSLVLHEFFDAELINRINLCVEFNTCLEVDDDFAKQLTDISLRLILGARTTGNTFFK